MASTNNNLLLQGVRGALGDLVIKQYKNKTVICKKPNMRNVQRSQKQKDNSTLFACAAAYAKAIVNDPIKKQSYAAKVATGQSVYNFAIREFLNMHKQDESKG